MCITNRYLKDTPISGQAKLHLLIMYIRYTYIRRKKNEYHSTIICCIANYSMLYLIEHMLKFNMRSLSPNFSSM